jgi:hypothetical protein
MFFLERIIFQILVDKGFGFTFFLVDLEAGLIFNFHFCNNSLIP